MISGDAQMIDETIALETAARIPQYVAERVLQYELVAESLDVLPVDRIRRARSAVIYVYTRWPAKNETHTVQVKSVQDGISRVRGKNPRRISRLSETRDVFASKTFRLKFVRSCTCILYVR